MSFQASVGKLDIVLCLVAVVLHVADIATDLYTAHNYRMNQDYVWFGFTVTVVLIPLVIMHVFYWRIEIYDTERKTIWYVRIIMCVFLLGPLCRSV